MVMLSTMATESKYPDQWQVIIPDYFPPSLNKTKRTHWSKDRKHKITAIEKLAMYALVNGHPDRDLPVFVGDVRVKITRLWGKGQRAWDIENLYGAVKPLVDAMRAEKKARKGSQGGLGLIEDDNPDMLDLVVKQRKNIAEITGRDADAECTLIVIEGTRVECG